MLENVVAWVLNNYIGEYLENLNTDQLSVALLSGQLELENVPLKKTALRKLDIPLEVKSGVLGKLTLSVPLTHIRSEPWVLKLSDVLIIVGPASDKKYDVETSSDHTEKTKKETMLDELEKKHKTQLLETIGQKSAASDAQESWWGASLIATVVNNIQLILTNVHIRYEDGQTLPNGLSFVSGVRIRKMTVQTTNHHWKSGFVEPQEGVNVFKKLELQGFSFYWNSGQPLSKDINTVKELQNLLAPEDAGKNTYIIEPCSIELRMEKNASKFPLKGDPAIPRFKFWLRPEKIVVELSRRQMSELRALNREWSRFERARTHRKWRPVANVMGNAREWWRFAYDRVLDDTRRTNTRKTWSFALTRARHLNAYARAYRRRLIMLMSDPTYKDQDPTDSPARTADPARPSMGHEERTIMKQIERDEQYTFTELQLFRETVFRRLLREKETEMGIVPEGGTGGRGTPTADFEALESPGDEVPGTTVPPPKNQGLYSWFSSFFTGEQPEEASVETSFDFGQIDMHELKNIPPAFKEIEKQVEEELRDLLHDSWDDSTLLRKDLLLAEIALKLDQLTLRFVDVKTTGWKEERRVLAVDLMQLTSRVDLSPRTHTLSVSLSVHDLSVQRLITTCKRHREESMHNVEFDESLMYSKMENTKVLLAIGRGTQSSDLSKPLFKMQYRRRSPRLIVRHTVEGTFRPISVMCDENAFSGIGALFDDDPDILFSAEATAPIDQDQGPGLASSDAIVPNITLESHVFVDFHLPNLCIVLRKKGWDSSGRPKLNAPVEQFACVNVDSCHFGVVSKEQFVSTVTLDVGHMDIQDMLENTAHPFPLLSTKKTRDMKAASVSCPNLTTIVDSNDECISNSLPKDGYLSSYSATYLFENRKMTDNSRKTSTAVRGTKDDQRSSVEARIKCTVVDQRHPEFETRFGRVCFGG
ncbi:unnamed protein product, partial [Mesorhabditis spiculigera]